jgi:predicted nucleic acid-binding protein
VATRSPVVVVPDASVLAGWVLPDEEDCAGSERLMADVEAKRAALMAPTLLKHEFMNALAVAVRRRRMAPEDAVLAWEAFMDLGILFAEPGRLGRSILALSSIPGVTAYDATYVAVAESYGCTCYTLDRNLVTVLRGHTDRVRLVSEYPSNPPPDRGVHS